MSARIRAWARAARPASQSYIALPLLLGQAVAFRHAGAIDGAVLAWVLLFGVSDQLYIVFGNDYADRATDRDNATPTAFSGGSRVLVEGRLTPVQLRRAAVGAAAGVMLVALVLVVGHGRPWALPLGALALVLLWAYSFPPLALSYRGGGELLQTLGVGLCLPLLGYYAQLGSVSGFPWPLLGVLLPAHLACAIATALPDEPSDRRARKRTLVVLLGPRAARRLIAALDGLSLLVLLALPGLAWAPGHPSTALLALPALATLGVGALPLRAPGSAALTALVALAVVSTLGMVAVLTVAQLAPICP